MNATLIADITASRDDDVRVTHPAPIPLSQPSYAPSMVYSARVSSDLASKSILRQGLLTKQLALTDGVQLTGKASPQFLRTIAPMLKDKVVLTPPIPGQTQSGQGQIYLQSTFFPSVTALLKEIAAATKTIDEKYAAVRGLLGSPVGAIDWGAKDVYFRRYERGAIYLPPKGVAYEVHGAIYQKYVALGEVASVLGFPLTDELSTVFETGRFNHFQGGSIYWTGSTGAWEIHGAIRDKWWQLDGDRSYLGYPISDEQTWIDPDSGQPSGAISHFQNGNIAFRSGDGALITSSNSVVLTANLGASSVDCSVELRMNSAGDWRYKGHMHNSGFVGFNVTVASTLNFQDASGNILAFNVERHLDGTTSFGDERSDDWDQFGSEEAFIRENWASIQYAGMRSHMDVDTTFGDIVQLIAAGFPIAVGVIIVAAIAGGGRVCPVRGTIRRDPYDHTEHREATFDVVGADEQCPGQ